MADAAVGPGWASRLLITPIRWYQRFISPALPASCRFYPTCSAYAATAIAVHGPVRGLWLGIRRLGRCHPWNEGGIDHVPPARGRRAREAAASADAGATSTDLARTDVDPAGSVPAVATTDQVDHSDRLLAGTATGTASRTGRRREVRE